MYIFGFDIPLMECLFVFLILLYISLFIIMIEVRKLLKLIVQEDRDINKLEKDIRLMKDQKINLKGSGYKIVIYNHENKPVRHVKI